MSVLKELKKVYDDFLESSEGADPDFPMVDFGGKGKKVKGTNITKAAGDETTMSLSK